MNVRRSLTAVAATVALLLAAAGRADDAVQSDPALAAKVLQTMQAAGCQSCHTAGGVAADTRLRVPAGAPSSADLQAFEQGARRLVDASHPERSLLRIKPTFRIAHSGGRLVEPDSPQDALLQEWIDQLAKLGQVSDPAAAEPAPQRIPASQMLRRLTHSQYNNTVRDLLGDHSRIADRFPPEDFVNGFKNQVQAQDIPPLLAEAYSAAAEKLARNAFRGGDRHGLVPCRPASSQDAACAAEFIQTLGRRAFRRPLEQHEMDLYSSLFLAEAADTGEFLEGARLVVEVMLQSPKFLFHPEPGPDAQRTAYARANRLSYFLWNTLPDEELLAAAESGGLDTPEGLQAEARRLLADPRAREAVDGFFAQWLRFDLTLNTVRDRRLYREFSPELAIAMVEETRRLFADIVWNDRDFRELLTARYTFVNSDLAKLYGVPAPASEFGRVELPADSPRAGILGHASFLTMTSKPGETSPTVRGLFVREHLLCETIPDPPPDATATLPPLTEDKPLANRELLGVHLTNPTCAGCHNLIDPVGFGLEMYDAVGRRREKQSITFFPTRAERDKEPVTVEVDINPEGIVAGVSRDTFSSPRQLGELLAASPRCQECFVRQLFRYATGREEFDGDEPAIEKAAQAFRTSGFRFQELMVALVATDAFTGANSDFVRAEARRAR